MRKALFILTLFACVSCIERDNYMAFTGYAQGGTYTIKANLKGVDTDMDEIGHTIDSLLNQIDFTLSGYNKKSILSRRNAGEYVQENDLFKEVYGLSVQYGEDTGGAFDIFSAPLFDIWGFGFKSGEFPTQDEVNAAMEECGQKKVLNFNAIAQGFSCDVIAAYLHSIGVKDMLVDIGEIYCEGRNPSGEGWSIAVDNPVDGNNTPGADIRGIWSSECKPRGLVTSGNYRKFYIKDGKKYSHTIDPRTGRPVDHDLLSATISAPTAAQADAYATACMVMGMEKAKDFISSRDGIEGFLIGTESTWTSPGFCLQTQ